MSEKTDWGFYGREKEIADLKSLLESKGFRSPAMIGRRGIGKAEVIKRAIAAAELPDGQPVVFLRMKDTIDGTMKALDRALKETGQIGLMEDNDKWNWWETLTEQQKAENSNEIRYNLEHLINHLLTKQAIVVLDEFQIIRDMELDGGFAGMIDEFRLVSGTRTNGKLLVAGSHQQKMLAMLREDQPLYLRLRPRSMSHLTSTDLLQMAAEQGWLRHPGRFLTMFAVYDGIPELWKTYYDEAGDIDRLEDDESWRQAFFQMEINRVLGGETHYRFDDPNHSDLSDIAKAILSYIARYGSEAGVRVNTIRENARPGDIDRQEWNRGFRDAVLDLANHLKVVASRSSRITPESELWVSAPNVLFQLNVQNYAIDLEGREASVEEKSETLLEWIITHQANRQGPALAKFTAGWIHSGLGYGAGYGYRQDDIEVDAHGNRLLKQADGTYIRELIVASCKRSPKELMKGLTKDLENMSSVYQTMWKRLDDEDNAEQLEYRKSKHAVPEDFPLRDISYRTRRMVVTPDFPPDYQAPEGVEAVDIREMARMAGLDPDTGQTYETEQEFSAPDSDYLSP